MQAYIGTKMIEATPQLRTSKMEGADDMYVEGYAVRYPDGYESWSPKEAFEDAYRKNGAFDFGAALFLLKRGYRMRRRGWNGQGMFVFLVAGSTFQVSPDHYCGEWALPAGYHGTAAKHETPQDR